MKSFLRMLSVFTVLGLVSMITPPQAASACRGCGWDGRCADDPYRGYGGCNESYSIDNNGTISNRECETTGFYCGQIVISLGPDGTTLRGARPTLEAKSPWKVVAAGELALPGCAGQLVGYSVTAERAEQIRAEIQVLTL